MQRAAGGGEGGGAPLGRTADRRARRVWSAAAAAILGVGVLAAAVLAAALLPVVTQDPAYHRFADRRVLLHVPNALDVLSNLALTLAGAAGLRAALRRGAFPDPRARGAWVVLFAAVLATSAGSVWYHLAPASPRLVWDRLPIAVGFMALVAALAGDRFGAAAGRRVLPWAVLVGAATVGWWWLGDGDGRGNLLPYVVLQGAALAAIPLLLVGRARAAGPRAPWLAALALYVLAKVLEGHDHAVFAAVGVSGHTLKHLVAAAAIGVLAREVSRRGRAYGTAAGAEGSGSRSSMLE